MFQGSRLQLAYYVNGFLLCNWNHITNAVGSSKWPLSASFRTLSWTVRLASRWNLSAKAKTTLIGFWRQNTANRKNNCKKRSGGKLWKSGGPRGCSSEHHRLMREFRKDNWKIFWGVPNTNQVPNQNLRRILQAALQIQRVMTILKITATNGIKICSLSFWSKDKPTPNQSILKKSWDHHKSSANFGMT